jgi:hypothetical protein
MSMNFYGFVFAASDDAIESVSARVIGECSSATYAIFDDLPITALDFSRILFIAKSEIRHEVEEAVAAVCNVYNSWCLNQVVKKIKMKDSNDVLNGRLRLKVAPRQKTDLFTFTGNGKAMTHCLIRLFMWE